MWVELSWGVLSVIHNKKNHRRSTAAMFVDGPDFFSVLAQLVIEGNILTKFKKSAQRSLKRWPDLSMDQNLFLCLHNYTLMQT